MISDEQHQLIYRHLELVLKENEKTNLTRIDSWEEGVLLHIEDSLSALDVINRAPSGRYGDLGTGAGYPGIPLAIATGRETCLIEARKKKADILRAMVKELNLQQQVRVFEGRAELLARKEPYSFTVLTARALAQLSVLMELASPLLKKNGQLICYKSHISNDEWESAKRVQDHTGLKLLDDYEITLKGSAVERKIVCFEKIAEPKTRLPRKEGEAQKHPL